MSQKKLQKQGLLVSEQLKILSEFEEKIFGTDAACKLASTLEKNPALKIIKENNAKYLYAPLTSCAIERLFSLVRSKQLNSSKILIKNMENLLFMRI